MGTASSVETYAADDRDLNLATMASLQTSGNNSNGLSSNAEEDDIYCYFDDADNLIVLDFNPKSSSPPSGKQEKPLVDSSASGKGESSNSKKIDDPEFVCEICIEPTSQNESFRIKGCPHAYCKGCMNKYVASKLQENISSIGCPVTGCGGSLEPEHCRSILPQDVFERWGNALCESVILGSQKFYCPYKDCSALMLDDGGQVVRESECPNCRRLFCAKCKVPWHSEINCEEFQKLHEDERDKEDIMLTKLAQNKQWRRCPSCRIYVERVSGCGYMLCRCKYAFCYYCGSPSDRTTHICLKCKRCY